MRTAYWVTFTNRKPACAWVEGESAARELAAKVGVVKSITTIPYPANPRLDDRDGWGEDQCPSFCYEPNQCVGRTACPSRFGSCTE